MVSKCLDWVIEILEECVQNKHYGEVRVIFLNGNPEVVKKGETLKKPSK